MRQILSVWLLWFAISCDPPAPGEDARVVVDGSLGADGGARDGQSADAEMPDGLMPDGRMPDASLPDGLMPDGLMPDGLMSDASLPDAVMPDGRMPDASLPDASLPDGRMPDAVAPDAAQGGNAFSRLHEEVSAAGDVQARQALVDEFMTSHGLLTPSVFADEAVFIYWDQAGELPGVYSEVHEASELNDWSYLGASSRMTRLADTDLYFSWWSGLPLDARVDYKFVLHQTSGGYLWIQDARNPHQAPGVGGDNSELRMPDYQPSPWIAFRAEVEHGWVGELSDDVNSFGGYPTGPCDDPHQIFVYFPPGHMDGSGPYGALLVNDGQEYKEQALLANVADNLLAEGLIAPVVLIFISPNERNSEYFGDCAGACAGSIAAYLSYLNDKVLYFARQHWKVSSDPAQVGIMGASYGGHVSLRAAFERPDLYGLVAAQSARVDAPYNGEFPSVLADYGTPPPKPLKIYLDTGTINDLYDDDLAFYQAAQAAGYTDLSFTAYSEGHAWGNWRARLDEVLISFFGVTP